MVDSPVRQGGQRARSGQVPQRTRAGDRAGQQADHSASQPAPPAGRGGSRGQPALLQAELWTGSVTLSRLLRNLGLPDPGLPIAGA